MITSSKANAITFINVDGGNPNRWNTLHENRKQGGLSVYPYCQQFNKDDVIYLQFTSDSATVPDLNVYFPVLNDTIAGTLASSYTSGLDTRYFYNFSMTLGSAYYDKKITFTITQDSDTLTSEPIYCRDLTDDLADGKIKYLKYTNLDRNESDLSDYWIDWSVVGDSNHFMFFYVEAIDNDVQESDEVEVLDGSQSKTIISANYFSGIKLKTGGIPDYLVEKIGIVSSLDVFEVNGIQYIKEGEIEVDNYGQSTFKQVSLNLSIKNITGLNVDDLGITLTDTSTVIVVKRNTAVTTSGWQVENTSGYMTHSVLIRHAATSAGDAVVNLGISISGDELIDDVLGTIALADFPSTGEFKSYPLHFLNDDSAYTLYFSVTGAGAVLDIIVNLDTIS